MQMTGTGDRLRSLSDPFFSDAAAYFILITQQTLIFIFKKERSRREKSVAFSLYAYLEWPQWSPLPVAGHFPLGPTLESFKTEIRGWRQLFFHHINKSLCSFLFYFLFSFFRSHSNQLLVPSFPIPLGRMGECCRQEDYVWKRKKRRKRKEKSMWKE